MTRYEVRLVAAAINAEIDWDLGNTIGKYNLQEAVDRTTQIEKVLLEQFKRFKVEFKAAEPNKNNFKIKPVDFDS